MSRASPLTVEEALARPVNGFAVVRLALALAVVVSHAFSVTTGRVDDEPLAGPTGFTLGEHAVNGFFALSGFLVTMSFMRRGPADYAIARTLRIAPGLVAATLLVTFGLGAALTRLDPASYLADPATWRFVVGTLTTFKSNAALPGVFPENAFRSPLGTVWTLKYEVLCYAALLAAGLAGFLRGRWPATALAAALCLGLIALEIVAPDGPKARQTALRLPFLFASGCALYLWRERVPVSGAVLAALATAAGALAWTPAGTAVMFLAVAYGAIYVALSPALARSAFDLRRDLSYGVYLYGWPIQQALRQLFPSTTGTALLAPSILLALAAASLSWSFVERPALKLKERWLGQPRIAP